MVDLPLPGGPTMPVTRPGANLEAHIAQHRRGVAVAPVAEGHVLEANHPFADLEVARARLVPDLRLQVEYLEQAPAAGRVLRATEFTVHAIWRTGIWRMAMKARKDANSPMVSTPSTTFSPPTHSTRPIETKKAKVIVVGALHEDIDAAVRDGERSPGNCVEAGHLECLGHEGAHHADAAEVLLHDPGEHRELLLQRIPQGAEPESGERGAERHEGHEAEARDTRATSRSTSAATPRLRPGSRAGASVESRCSPTAWCPRCRECRASSGRRCVPGRGNRTRGSAPWRRGRGGAGRR